MSPSFPGLMWRTFLHWRLRIVPRPVLKAQVQNPQEHECVNRRTEDMGLQSMMKPLARAAWHPEFICDMTWLCNRQKNSAIDMFTNTLSSLIYACTWCLQVRRGCRPYIGCSRSYVPTGLMYIFTELFWLNTMRHVSCRFCKFHRFVWVLYALHWLMQASCRFSHGSLGSYKFYACLELCRPCIDLFIVFT